jgi:small-conductance mechanosensitive channel
METLALTMLIITGLLIIPAGFLALFLFGMSFDAPGSGSDPKQWLARIGFIVIPFLIPVALLYFGYQAYQVSNYERVIQLTALPVLLALGGLIYIKFS